MVKKTFLQLLAVLILSSGCSSQEQVPVSFSTCDIPLKYEATIGSEQIPDSVFDQYDDRLTHGFLGGDSHGFARCASYTCSEDSVSTAITAYSTSWDPILDAVFGELEFDCNSCANANESVEELEAWFWELHDRISKQYPNFRPERAEHQKQLDEKEISATIKTGEDQELMVIMYDAPLSGALYLWFEKTAKEEYIVTYDWHIYY